VLLRLLEAVLRDDEEMECEEREKETCCVSEAYAQHAPDCLWVPGCLFDWATLAAQPANRRTEMGCSSYSAAATGTNAHAAVSVVVVVKVKSVVDARLKNPAYIP
jgi:hypothetical protein